MSVSVFNLGLEIEKAKANYRFINTSCLGKVVFWISIDCRFLVTYDIHCLLHRMITPCTGFFVFVLSDSEVVE